MIDAEVGLWGWEVLVTGDLEAVDVLRRGGHDYPISPSSRASATMHFKEEEKSGDGYVSKIKSPTPHRPC